MTTIQGVKVLPSPPAINHVGIAIQNALSQKGHIHVLKPEGFTPKNSKVPVQLTTIEQPIVLQAMTPIVSGSNPPNSEVPSVAPTPSNDVSSTEDSTASSTVPSTSSTPSVSSSASLVSKVQILYPDEAIESTDLTANHEIGLIDCQSVEGNTGYVFTISTKNPDPLQYMAINILTKSHVRYSTHAIPFDDDNVYNGNCAQFEIRNMDKKDMTFSIQYIAYF